MKKYCVIAKLTLLSLLIAGCSSQTEKTADAEAEATNPDVPVLGEDVVVINLAEDVDIPAMDDESFREYELFKAWRRALQPDSPEYYGFQTWLEYQEYLRVTGQ